MTLTTAQAALKLGVSDHEVRRLIAAGELTAASVGRMLLVDETSLHRRAQHRGGRGRALAPRTAWAALQEASGERALWLDSSTRSRLRRWLRAHDPEGIALACRRRSEQHDLRVLPAYRSRILADAAVRAAGITAADSTGADIVSGGEHPEEIYCHAITLRRLTASYGLVTGENSNLIIRVPTFTDVDLLDRSLLPPAVVAVDLMESIDVRSRRAGSELLQQQLDEHLA